MSLIKRNNAYWGLNPFLSDFLEKDDAFSDRFWKKEIVPVNISETEQHFEIEFAVPGMDKNDFKIAIKNGLLTVSGEHKEEKEKKKKNYTRQEYSYNSFSRSFNLPDNAMEEEVKANYENGVLKLHIGKKKETESKERAISVG